jgi:hypothetical protein
MRASRRTVVAALAAFAVLGGGALALIVGTSSRAPELPRISPASLIASMAGALRQDRPISGSVQMTMNLGLPQIVDLGSQAGPVSLLNGTHEFRIWRSAAGFRLSDLEPTGERALFVSHGRAWAWDFDSLTAYDIGRLPQATASPFGLFGGVVSEEAVREVLAAVSDTTRVAVSGATTVAGRPAYRLVLAPKQGGTLVGAVEIDVDSETRMPLAVSVFPRTEKAAAISLRFSSVSFESIDPAVFEFEPPPGARVRHVGIDTGDIDRLLAVTHSFQTFGGGWTSVLAVRGPPVAEGGLGGPVASGLLRFQGSLVSVAVADRGDHSWLLLGIVPLTRVESFESRLP